MQSLTSKVTQSLRAQLFERYRDIRQASERLCEGLAVEDYVVQTCFEVSPPKWHLAHTSWFWDQFILAPFAENYKPFDARFYQFFNSYYVSLGKPLHKEMRGMFSRPTVEEVFRYRRHVDTAMEQLLQSLSDELLLQNLPVIELGINHEEQHFELLGYDLQHIRFINRIGMETDCNSTENQTRFHTNYQSKFEWISFEEVIYEAGYCGSDFCFDNEQPTHRVFLEPFSLANRLVNQGEWLQFMEAGGYSDSRYWLSDGWAKRESENWQAPLYWLFQDGKWWVYVDSALQAFDPVRPVAHISFYEADAYARWAGARLPTEFEWEHAAKQSPVHGTFSELLNNREMNVPTKKQQLQGMHGELWQWTQSAYAPYPGYACLFEGPAEYNGKFMANQLILRGGSRFTPQNHYRPTYRNFFYPFDRWQCSGLRLARSN